MVVPYDVADSAQDAEVDRVIAWLDSGGDVNDVDQDGFTLINIDGYGSPPFMNFYYGYFEDTKGEGNWNDYKLVLSLRQWGPDGKLTQERYDNREFFPVMDNDTPYAW